MQREERIRDAHRCGAKRTRLKFRFRTERMIGTCGCGVERERERTTAMFCSANKSL